MNSSQSGNLTAIERARYKLLQAEIALSYLRQMSEEIAKDRRRARPISDPDPRLDTFFFSCLGLAKSAFYIAERDQRGRSKGAIHLWRANVLYEIGSRQFNRMMLLRDHDVHHGLTEGKALPTLIPIERGSNDDGWMYQQQPNCAPRGITRPAA